MSEFSMNARQKKFICAALEEMLNDPWLDLDQAMRAVSGSNPFFDIPNANLGAIFFLDELSRSIHKNRSIVTDLYFLLSRELNT